MDAQLDTGHAVAGTIFITHLEATCGGFFIGYFIGFFTGCFIE
jgi:hypothetical protein